MNKQPMPCDESEGFASPQDHVDRLGRLFVATKIQEKYGLTFDRYLALCESGDWPKVAAHYVA